MKSGTLNLIATVIGALASIIVLFEFMRRRGQPEAPAVSSGGAMDFSSTGPTFIMQSRERSAAPSMSLASCGCGGSYGDPSAPALSPVFSAAQRTIPYEKKPLPEGNPLLLLTLGNGAA
jgi:hypothetical protein